MERFNLDEYLKNPTRKVVTGTGRNVRIICTDKRNTKCPIIALIEDEDKEVRTFTKDGCWNVAGDETSFNLFFAPEKKEGWINLFRDPVGNEIYCSKIYPTKERAMDSIGAFYATIKVEWEE